jgi:formylglycine-generating enzyme required for sulfatase activity
MAWNKLFIALWVILLFAAGCTNTTQYSRPTSGGQKPEGASSNSAQKNCPAGFIKVPGNPLYRTTDFCVMKYDAKCADISNPTVGLKPPLGDPASGASGQHAYGVYKNNGPGAGCVAANRKQIVSTASGFPITYIPESDNTRNNVKSYAAALGWHLMTNDEWMTIARNVEQVQDNWCDSNGTNCGSAPGTKGKILANGHSDNSNETSAGGSGFDSALIAGHDDQACFGTTTDGSNACGGKGSQKRTLTLSNGQVIWDFAGNVWQWVDGTVQRKDEPKSASNGKLDVGWLSSEFAPGALPSVITDNGQGPSLGYDSFRPSNPAWNSNNGVGRIFHYSSAHDTNTTVYGFIRGGQWNHGTVDGAFSMHLTPVPDKPNINDVGFRLVAPLQ